MYYERDTKHSTVKLAREGMIVNCTGKFITKKNMIID